MTVEQYEAIADAGILTPRDKVHLINGYLVAKMTHHPPHATADELCRQALSRMIPPGWYVRGGKPVRLPGIPASPSQTGRGAGSLGDYSDRHPGPLEVALVVEVSKSSLAEDRKMAEIYGRAGIPAYWIINLIDRQVEVYSNPGPGGYDTLEVLAPGHVLSVVIDGVEVGQIAVDDILPRQRSPRR